MSEGAVTFANLENFSGILKDTANEINGNTKASAKQASKKNEYGCCSLKADLLIRLLHRGQKSDNFYKHVVQ